MFCLVEFDGPSQEIGIAHKKSWISGSKCYWPPFWKNNSRLVSALKKGTRPDPSNWSLFEVHIIGSKFFESYDEARKKLNYPPSRLDASDLSSTDEVVQRLRKRPLNEPESSSSEDDSHGLFKSPPSEKRKKMPTKSQAIFSPPPPPPVPAMKDFSGSVPTPTLVAVETLNSNPTIGSDPGMSSQSLPGTSYSFVQANLEGSQFIDDYHSGTVDESINRDASSPLVRSITSSPATSAYRGLSNPVRSTNFGSTVPSSSGIYVSADILQSIQVQQAILTAKVDLCLNMLGTIQKGQRLPEQSTGQFNLPITTVEDANILLSDITENRDSRNDLGSVLSTTGGDNINQITYRVLATLMTDDLMNKYSFAGKKGKLCFRDTLFLNVICDAVRKQPKGSIGSDKEIGKAVEYWLKKASLRLSKRTT